MRKTAKRLIPGGLQPKITQAPRTTTINHAGCRPNPHPPNTTKTYKCYHVGGLFPHAFPHGHGMPGREGGEDQWGSPTTESPKCQPNLPTTNQIVSADKNTRSLQRRAACQHRGATANTSVGKDEWHKESTAHVPSKARLTPHLFVSRPSLR